MDKNSGNSGKRHTHPDISFIRAVSYETAVVGLKDYQINNLDNSFMAHTATEIR